MNRNNLVTINIANMISMNMIHGYTLDICDEDMATCKA